jgi:hypothetical protein
LGELIRSLQGRLNAAEARAEKAEAALRNSTNEPTQASAPTDKSEWVLVPRDLTPAMLTAIGESADVNGYRSRGARLLYRAMLAAAPPAPTQAGDSMTHADWLRACTAWLDDPQMRPSVLDHMNLAAEALTAASQREAALREALGLALAMLFPHEPPDSRCVSNEFVAMAAVLSDDMSERVMSVIRESTALATNPGERP